MFTAVRRPVPPVPGTAEAPDGTETLFAGIHRLTERATAYFGGGLHLHYPEPALHSHPRELDGDADVLAAFTETIDGALDLRPLQPEATVFHLTGGFDSGTIATHAAQRWPGRLTTAALLVTGAGRAQQIRRRTRLRAQVPFGEHDILTDCRDYPSLHPDCARVRGEAISPYEEPLHLPFARLTALLAELGAQAVGPASAATRWSRCPPRNPPPSTRTGWVSRTR